jgi:hypothetical protein
MILQSIQGVRAELKTIDQDDPRELNDVMMRLNSLYACLDVERIAKILSDSDTRYKHGKDTA